MPRALGQPPIRVAPVSTWIERALSVELHFAPLCSCHFTGRKRFHESWRFLNLCRTAFITISPKPAEDLYRPDPNQNRKCGSNSWPPSHSSAVPSASQHSSNAGAQSFARGAA
eukprot:350941-Chlamydomonas_euryale.AAC.13